MSRSPSPRVRAGHARGGSRTDEGSNRTFESVVAEVSQEGADSERASDESEAIDNRPDTPEGTGSGAADAANADNPAANASTRCPAAVGRVHPGPRPAGAGRGEPPAVRPWSMPAAPQRICGDSGRD